METILIADDHQLIRRGIRMIIESLPGTYQLVEAASCAEVMRTLAGQKVHYTILDMILADGNIFTDTAFIPTYSNVTSILVYSMTAEKVYGRRLIQKGVRGFVSKKAGIEDLEAAIKTLLKGDIYLSPELKEELVRAVRTQPSGNPLDALSDRELGVVEYAVLGMGSKEIARKMNLDITTISTYRRRAFKKLEVQNLDELKNKFIEHNI